MPKYLCSYAYDVPHYADFTIEAPNLREAEKRILSALDAGHFTNVECHVPGDPKIVAQRVFVQAKITATEDTAAHPTMEELTGEPAPSATSALSL